MPPTVALLFAQVDQAEAEFLRTADDPQAPIRYRDKLAALAALIESAMAREA